MPDTPEFKETGQGPRYSRGTRWPASALIYLPFLIIYRFLYQAVKRQICWTSVWATVIFFELVLLPIEAYHLSRGHWVYNEARIFGPKIFGVPIEEPLLYYLFSPIIIISVFQAFKQHAAKKSPKGEK